MREVRKLVVFIPLLVFLLLSGCSNSIGAIENSSEDIASSALIHGWDINEITYQEGVWPGESWKAPQFPVKEESVSIEAQYISDAETAVQVASSLVGSFKHHDYFSNYAPQYIFFDVEGKIWYIAFWETWNNDAPIVGSDFTIAIRQKNAEVLGMWVGE